MGFFNFRGKKNDEQKSEEKTTLKLGGKLIEKGKIRV